MLYHRNIDFVLLSVKHCDVISGFTKTVQHSMKNISRKIKAVFFKLGIRTVHHKRSKMTPVVLLP